MTGGDIRLKGHGCGVSIGTPGSRLPARHYAIRRYSIQHQRKRSTPRKRYECEAQHQSETVAKSS